MLRHDRLYCVVGSAVPGLAAGARAGRAGRTLGVLGGCSVFVEVVGFLRMRLDTC